MILTCSRALPQENGSLLAQGNVVEKQDRFRRTLLLHRRDQPKGSVSLL